jgi:hypothetical protein
MYRSAFSALAISLTLPSAAQTTQRTHPATQAKPQPTAASSLPIRRVALYKNGVGFFEHAGQVHGDDHVTIDFTTAQLNDVLQTLTAVDLGGGRIAGAGYNSTTPVEQQLRSLPLTLGADPSAADFYTAIRGARVEVTGTGVAITGRILNVELRQTAVTKDDDEATKTVSKHFPTVISDSGEVRTVELNAKTGVRLLDASLHGDVNRYLQILADNHRDGLRHLTLADNGTGTREVRVSYISEVPVWKSTYRILFDTAGKAGAKQATLQGWAVVDNTVGADWNNVQLSLIAGAPQSFIQPISQPYYNRRPEIGLPEEAQLTPQTHESGEMDMDTRLVPALDAMTAVPRAAGALGKGSGGGIGAGSFNGLGPGSGGNTGGGTYIVNGRNAAPAPIAYEDSASASIAPSTTTAGFDDFFEYKLNDPVTITKNQSALVPILQTKVDVDPVTLYSVGENTARRALWITNTSKLTLDRGSFSILEGGNFSGQGLLDPIHPGERRLLSYAADTAVRVTPDGQANHSTRHLQQVTIAYGVMTEKTREVNETEYLVHNAAAEARTVIVEAPRRRGWELDSDPKPEEATATIYRFRVVTQPGETVRLHVGQRHTLSTRYALATTYSNQIEVLLKQDGDPANVRTALQPVLDAKLKLSVIEAQIQSNGNETNQIANDQKRLRDNLAALKGSAEERSLVKRYTEELNAQEDQLAALHTTLTKLQADRDAAQANMIATVQTLNLTVDLP